MGKVGRRQYRSGQALGNPLVLPTSTLPLVPPTYPTFGVKPMFYIPLTTLIQRPDDMLSSPLGQHILDYEPLCRFVILAFTTFDGLADPYDHMLHYNQVMTLNVGNDLLLCQGTKNRIYHQNIEYWPVPIRFCQSTKKSVKSLIFRQNIESISYARMY